MSQDAPRLQGFGRDTLRGYGSCARHNVRGEDMIHIMEAIADGTVGKCLRYQDLIADNDMPSRAQST